MELAVKKDRAPWECIAHWRSAFDVTKELISSDLDAFGKSQLDAVSRGQMTSENIHGVSSLFYWDDYGIFKIFHHGETERKKLQ